MYVGHYKSVVSSKEFYSSMRDSLDFPAQVEVESERYLLNTTYAVPSKSMLDNIYKRADDLGIPKDIPVK